MAKNLLFLLLYILIVFINFLIFLMRNLKSLLKKILNYIISDKSDCEKMRLKNKSSCFMGAVHDVFSSVNFNVEDDIKKHSDKPDFQNKNKSPIVEIIEVKDPFSSTKEFIAKEKYDSTFFNSLEGDLKEFVCDRISTLNYEDEKDIVAIEKWAFSVSDFLSELNDLRISNKLSEVQHDTLVAPLLEEMNHLKFSIVSLDYYDREFQKVVGVEIKDDLTEIKLKESVSWGVKQEERILKKQEIIIYKPSSKKES